jgi:hypothetical protein
MDDTVTSKTCPMFVSLVLFGDFIWKGSKW